MIQIIGTLIGIVIVVGVTMVVYGTFTIAMLVVRYKYVPKV